MSQIQYKTIAMVAFVMLLLLFNPPVYGAVPDYIILDHSNSNGAITGTAGPLTQKVGYANTDVSITNTKSFWTTIKLPPENSTFTLTPTNIYSSFGLIGPNKTATYKLDFYKESMANLGVDPTLESGAGASIMNIVQILLTGLQADFIMDEMFDLSDWLMEAYQIEALNEAANLFLSKKPVNAAWTLANTVYQKDILSKILQLLQKVGYTGNIKNLEDKLQIFGIYSIMKQVGDQAWTYLFENPSGYVYFDAKKSNAGEIDPYIVCNFSATPQNAPVNTPITFDASQSIAYKDTIVSYKWNFGDGTITETTSPSTTHSYKTTGYYYTGLTIKSALGKGQAGWQSITIGDVTTGGRYFAGGTLTESTTWAVENSPILIAGSLTIPDGVSLTIQDGVQVILNNGVSISVSGTLKATGVKFTAQDQTKLWGGITFDGAGSKDSWLENCVLEHALGPGNSLIYIKDSPPTIKGCTINKCSSLWGIVIQNGSPVIQGNTINGFSYAGIHVDGTSSPAVTGNTITNNQYGIYVSGSGTYQDNTISGNTEYGIYVSSANIPVVSGNTYSGNSKGDLSISGTIKGSVNWNETVVYNISSLSIPYGSSLTIASGRTLKLNGGGSINVSGTLIATGVKFTAAGITFDGAGSKDSRLENCVLEYAIGIYNVVIYVKDSSPTIKGCTISKCSSLFGIGIHNGSPVIHDNTINGFYAGIYMADTSSPSVTGNTITNNQYGISVNGGGGTYQGNTIKGNSSYGLYYSGTSVIDATNCDWGDPSGPLDDSDDRATGGLYNPNGKGNKVSDHVNYDPWGISEQLALSVSPASRSVAKAAGTTTFSVANTGTGTMPWTAAVTSGGSWLSITSGVSGSNAGTVTCSFNANNGAFARTGTIRVTATGATNSPQDVTVTQAGSLSVSPTSRDVTKEAGITSFSVSYTGTGTVTWNASVTSGSWLSITSGASGTNSGTINCSFTANTGASARTATIRVTSATDNPQDVTVTQAGSTQPVLSVSGSVLNSSGTGVSGVMITFSNSGGTATSDDSGNYSVAIPNNYSGTATPSKTGYTFTPASKSYSNVTASKTSENYIATQLTNPMIGSNSIGSRNTIKISDMSGTLPDSGGAIAISAWDVDGNALAESGSAAPLILSNHGTTSISGSNLAARFLNGTPMLYKFSVESSEVVITNVKNSTDDTFKVPIVYLNGTTNFVANSIGNYNTIKISDISGTLPAGGSAINILAWDANGNALAESGSAAPFMLFSHGTTSISGSNLVARFPSGSPMTYEFDVQSAKVLITNVKRSIDGKLNIPIAYTSGVSNFVSNSIGNYNTLEISDLSGSLSFGGGAISVEAWDANGNALSESVSAEILTLQNHGTTSISGSNLAARFPTGSPITYEFSIESSKVLITNVKSSTDGLVEIPGIFTSGISNFATNYVSDLNTIKISDMSGALPAGGVAITIKAWDTNGNEIPEFGGAAPLKLYSYGTTIIAGIDLQSRFTPGFPAMYEFSIGSSSAIVTSLTTSVDGTIKTPTVFTIGPYGGL